MPTITETVRGIFGRRQPEAKIPSQTKSGEAISSSLTAMQKAEKLRTPAELESQRQILEGRFFERVSISSSQVRRNVPEVFTDQASFARLQWEKKQLAANPGPESTSEIRRKKSRDRPGSC
jgi:hypothetical protein